MILRPIFAIARSLRNLPISLPVFRCQEPLLEPAGRFCLLSAVLASCRQVRGFVGQILPAGGADNGDQQTETHDSLEASYPTKHVMAQKKVG